MGKLIVFLILVAVPLYALIEAVRSPAEQVRFMSKWLWALLVFFLGIFGAVLWFVFGRPRLPANGGDSGGGSGGLSLPPGLGPRPRGPLAPDDDPEFLKRVDEQTWAARMERLRRERGEPANPQNGPAPEQPPSQNPGPVSDPGPD